MDQWKSSRRLEPIRLTRGWALLQSQTLVVLTNVWEQLYHLQRWRGIANPDRASLTRRLRDSDTDKLLWGLSQHEAFQYVPSHGSHIYERGTCFEYFRNVNISINWYYHTIDYRRIIGLFWPCMTARDDINSSISIREFISDANPRNKDSSNSFGYRNRKAVRGEDCHKIQEQVSGGSWCIFLQCNQSAIW